MTDTFDPEAPELLDGITPPPNVIPLAEARARQPKRPIVTSPSGYDATELGNARRLVDGYGHELRYADGLGWLAWDGARWRAGSSGHAIRRSKDVARAMKREAVALVDGARDPAKVIEGIDLLKWALKSQSRYTIDATVNLARSEPEIEVESETLDADPWLLNVQNGTLDLKTGLLRSHLRDDLITKLAPIEYDPDARSELWERFLEETTAGDSDLAGYLQRAAGYSLTGDTGEEVVFFVHGPGSTGKSTFMSAVKKALGDYAITADFETFLARRFGGGIRNDVARLAGARLVSSIEVEEGKQVAEGMIKELTGGDDVTARFLYREHFTYRPQFKLWLVANHKPRVRDDDEAIWRRIKVIPFSHVVPPERRDPAVKASLMDVAVSGPAILAWAVRGCLAWQRDGLGVPACVEQATATYRTEMDITARFWEECVLFETGWTATADLRKRYKAWADENGIAPALRLDDKNMADRLRSFGCADRKVKQRRGWLGVRLREVNERLDLDDDDEGADDEVAGAAG